jgi:ABC-type multidrug transport system fused ATPase/permease subunit
MVSDSPSSKISRLTDRISLLTQQRWALGDTIAENICLGKEFDPVFMQEVLKISQLEQDVL